MGYTVEEGSAYNNAAEVVAGVDGSGNVQALLTGTDGALNVDNAELPAAAALADNTTNPTTTIVGAALLGFDGTTWDRVKVVPGHSTAANQTLAGQLTVIPYGPSGVGGSSGNPMIIRQVNADAQDTTTIVGAIVQAWGYGYNGSTHDRLRTASSSGAGLGVQKVHEQNESALTLLSSAARTATAGTAGSAVTGLGSYKYGTLFLDVTAAATESNDTLDVYVQYSVDGGTTYDDYAHFTQVLGDGGAKQYVLPFNIVGTPAAGHAVQTAGLAANSFRAGTDFGDRLRVYWVIVDPTGTNASFTFSVKANFKG